MIQSASFRNFKSLRHVDIDLERLTVFVGPNATGKTSILEGLHSLSQVALMDPKEIFAGPRRPELLYTRGMTGESMDLECSGHSVAIRLRVGFLPWPPKSQSQSEPSSINIAGGFPPQLEWRDLSRPDSEWEKLTKVDGLWFLQSRVEWIASQFRSAVMLRLDALKLSEPTYNDRPKPRVEFDGTGLASVLAYVALNQPDKFALLQERIKAIIPPIKRIRFDRVPVTRTETEVVTIDSDRLTRRIQRDYIADEVVLDFEGASDIPAHLASEGTILVLGLLAVMMGPVRPKLVLIDDLDHGLHPKAQRKIIPLLRTILEDDQDLQIIATTHSPYIVDELDPKEVRITWAGDDGATQCGCLDSHPDFERWKDELWPGEFWSLVGEQWIANGQRPEKA
jgi:predicted ATPase